MQNVKEHFTVCSKHFKREDYLPKALGTRINHLKKIAVPSLNLLSTLLTEQKKNHFLVGQRKERAKKREQIKREINQEETPMEVEVISNVSSRFGNAPSSKEVNERTSTSPFQDKDTQMHFSEKQKTSKFEDKGTQTEFDNNFYEKQKDNSNKGRTISDSVKNATTDKDLSQGEAISEQKKNPSIQMSNTNSVSSNKIQTELSEILNNSQEKTSVCKEKSFALPDLLKNDRALNAVTGLKSFSILDYIEMNIAAKTKQGKDSNKKKKILLSTRSRIILTMTKLKQNMTFACLAVLFRISVTYCRKICYAMLLELHEVLKKLIRWPEKEEILENMPKVFANFPSTRIILDCTEIPIQKRKCLTCRIGTYSHYKKCNTVKFAVAVAPSGLITFVSDAYSGRSFDKFIVNSSGILNRVSRSEAVMVDKGFLIDAECRKRGITLIRPHFCRKNMRQFTAQQSNYNRSISSARVHIERIFQRVQIFKILKGPLTWDMAPWSKHFMTVVCAIVNLNPPILSIDKFV